MTAIKTVPSAAAKEWAGENRIAQQAGTRRPELLAPAGNYECFLAAVHAGADAVYLAGKQFGARAAADNFDEDELIAAIRYAHLFGRRVYMTVNTLLKEDELSGLSDYLKPYADAGLDAVIVQDFGVLSVIQREFPDLAVHCSTQMTITDEWGVRLAKELGAVRVVPARELSIAEIRHMKQTCPDMELECFVHGAMCYCYSGQCLMSSMIGGRSGNRGACAQPCRLPYDVEIAVEGIGSEQRQRSGAKAQRSDVMMQRSAAKMGQGAYPLSLKDLCAVELIPELIEAGIDSFKIEGRMKHAEYCAGVTAVYRAVIDRFLTDGEKAQGVTKEELSLLRGLYVRSGIGDGYYHCQAGGHMLTQDKPGYRGCDESVLAMLRTRYVEQRSEIPVRMTLSMTIGEAARLTVCHDETEVTCEGDLVQAAANKPLTADELKKRLQKTGGTPFLAEEIQISMTEAVFMPVGRINELRRKALAAMEEALLAQYQSARMKERQKAQPIPTELAGQAEQPMPTELTEQAGQACRITQQQKGLSWGEKGGRGYLAVADTKEQLAVCAAHPLLNGVCADVYVYEAYWRDARHGRESGGQTKSYYLYLPRILRKKDTERMETAIRSLVQNGAPIDGIYVHTAGEYRYALSLTEMLGKKPEEFLYGSPFLYCMNTESALFWQKRMRSLSMPYELCEREVYAFLKQAERTGVSGLEMPVYGHIPMMVTANCIVRSFDKERCPQPEARIWLKDRMGQRMYVKTECGCCLNTIYNSVPLSMHKHMPKLQKLYEDGMLGAFTLGFTVESAERTKEVLDLYRHPKEDAWAPGSYTNGHFQRGVV